LFLIRDARPTDLDDLQQVASHLDSVNLPDDRDRLSALITASQESFAARCDVADRRFVFVLTEADSGRVVGCSMVFAQHGSRRAPHVYFDVREEERYSQTLDRHFVHRVLRIGYNYKGLTEIGGLALIPPLRRHPERLGGLLFAVRFIYLALHRELFHDEVLSELMPPLEPDGTSRLWEALGRRFTGLSYQEADRLSHENKEFIRTLFPEEPIYATLLPKEVQDVVGQVGPATKGVETMLRRIGFEYAQRIDPFDGGPHFQAQIDDVTLVRGTRRVQVADGVPTPGQGARFLVAAECAETHAAEDRGGAPLFRAMATTVVLDGDRIRLSAKDCALLSVAAGDEVACLPLDKNRTS
jgi:arginine N-succinyltransferase